MKLTALTAILLISTVTLLPADVITDTVSVTVSVEGFRNQTGDALLTVFAEPDGFPDNPSKVILALSSSIDDKEVVFKFKLPAGNYAFSVLHDENSNEKMDRTWYGKPTEGFGVSNNPVIRRRAPTFEEAEVTVDKEHIRFEISLIYF